MQKIERQRVQSIPGKVGTPSKIKHQKIKEITGKSAVKPKKPSLVIAIGVGKLGKGMPSMGQSSKMRKMK